MYGFKDFDIRGTKEEGVDELLAEKIGKYYPDINKSKKVIVAHDHRTNSKKLLNKLIKGLKSRGLEIHNFGLMNSPMFYFLASKLKFNSGIIVTASHSPKEEHGFKFIKSKAQPIYSVNGLNDLEKLVIEMPIRKESEGKVINHNEIKIYHNSLLNYIKNNKKLKIVVDVGNGVGALDIPFLKKIANVKFINEKIDPNFKGRGPNPIVPGVLKELSKRVVQEKADFGVAYDGDSDRSVFVDDKGNVILADYVMALYTDYFAKKGDTIVYDLRLTKVIEEIAIQKKVKVVKSKVGHSRVVDMMIMNDGLLGSEYSGHFYFKELNYTDSGLFATIKMINLLSNQDKRLSEMLKKYKKYELSEEINLKIKDRSKINIFKKEKGKKSYLDGISIQNKTNWYNVRASHTENLVRVRVEAINKKELKETIKKIKEKLIN